MAIGVPKALNTPLPLENDGEEDVPFKGLLLSAWLVSKARPEGTSHARTKKAEAGPAVEEEEEEGDSVTTDDRFPSNWQESPPPETAIARKEEEEEEEFPAGPPPTPPLTAPGEYEAEIGTFVYKVRVPPWGGSM